MEKARPSEGEVRGQEHYLEEIHVAALSNVLRRPVIVLAEQFQGGLFLPLRHDPEACRLPDGRASPPLFLYLQFDHYLPLCPQDGRDFWAWAEREAFPGDAKALKALRRYEAARGTPSHRVPEWVEEIVVYIVAEVRVGVQACMRAGCEVNIVYVFVRVGRAASPPPLPPAQSNRINPLTPSIYIHKHKHHHQRQTTIYLHT